MKGLGLGLGLRLRRSGGSRDLNSGLLFYYDLGDLVDASGRGNTLTNNNTATFTQGGGAKDEYLTTVIASSQYLSRPDTADWDMAGGSFTIACWFRFTAGGANQGLIIKDATGGNRQWSMYVSSADRVVIELFNGISTLLGTATNTTALSINTWYFACWTFDAGTLISTITVNNATAVGVTATGTVPNGLANGTIGSRNGASLFFGGDITKVGKWNRALTATEQTYLYNGGAGRDYASLAVNGLRSTSLLYWDMADTSDSTGRGNTLTNVNTTTFVAGGKPGNCSNHVAASSQYFTRADGSDVRFGAANWSVFLWFYISSKNGNDLSIISKDTVSSNREFVINYNNVNDRIDCYLFNGVTTGRGTVSTASSSVTVGAWHSLAAWYDLAANVFSVQLNNGTIVTGTPSGALGSGTASLFVGDQNTLAIRMFNGNLDSIGKWQFVPSAAQLTYLYNGGYGRSWVDLS